MGNSQSMFLGHIYLYNEAIDYSLLKVPFISKSAKKINWLSTVPEKF